MYLVQTGKSIVDLSLDFALIVQAPAAHHSSKRVSTAVLVFCCCITRLQNCVSNTAQQVILTGCAGCRHIMQMMSW